MIFNYSFVYKHNPNNGGNRPIAVIANFNSDGRFIPIYFRYISDDSSESTIKITSIQSTKDKHDSISFYCSFNNGSIQQPVTLTFKYKECLWVLEG